MTFNSTTENAMDSTQRAELDTLKVWAYEQEHKSL